MDELLEESPPRRRRRRRGHPARQNVNSYGRDLTRAGRCRGAAQRRRRRRGDPPGPLHESHPKDFAPKTIADGDTEAVTPHLHLPLQSGSDRVLAYAPRVHGAAHIERLAGHARRSTTWRHHDLIVGFPQTEDDFDQTLAVVAERLRQHVHLHLLAPPGTRAAAMEADYVDRRGRRPLRAAACVVERSALVRHEARIGASKVLVEGPSRQTPTCSPPERQGSSCTSSRQRASASRRARSHASRSRAAPHH